MIKDFSGQLASTFAQKAKAIPFSEIKKQISVFTELTVKLIKRYEAGVVDSVTEDSVINK